jgi:hypothetical protein
MIDISTVKMLSIEEKLQVMEAIWQDLTAEEQVFQSPEWHLEALKETEQRYNGGERGGSGLGRCQERTKETFRMRLKILSSAIDDLYQARLFYERQREGLGEYFFDSLFSDIDSLMLYAGMHAKFYGYHRLLAKRFPYAVYYIPYRRKRLCLSTVCWIYVRIQKRFEGLCSRDGKGNSGIFAFE